MSSDHTNTLPGEFELIERLAALLPQPASGVLGIGDDCAVIPQPEGAEALLVTTDTLIEETHFSLDLSSAADVGWKSLAVSLSDVAAMGGEPFAAVIALGASPGCSSVVLEECYRGIAAAARRFGVSVVGGDTVRTQQLVLTLTLLARAAQPVLRSGAQPGDDIWVSGQIGGAAAGLSLLAAGSSTASPAQEALLARHRRPEPRVVLGRQLAAAGVRAMIDVSDGMLQDAGHIAARSGVQLKLELSKIPVVRDAAALIGTARALTGGDDYELLFSAPTAARMQLAALSCAKCEDEILPQLSRIGTAASGAAEVVLVEESGEVGVAEYLQRYGLTSAGYRHF